MPQRMSRHSASSGTVHMPHKILILGASYGSLLGIKLTMAGHDVHLVCLPVEADLFNAEGAIVRMPIKGRKDLVELKSKNYPGKLTASPPAGVDPAKYDLIALAMQEPQYRSAGVRELLDAVAKSRKPCMSIMNMPPLPYLKRLPGLDHQALRAAFTDATVWDAFDPDTMTLCSPDPQAFRPPDDKVNVLQVRLPTNFKAARFASDSATAMLRELESGIDAIRIDVDGGGLATSGAEVPVKLKVHESVYVPLAKWAMLLAGNYRCVGADAMRSIKEAVHTDIAATKAVYAWVSDLCIGIGADKADMVPFEKYANAAQSLLSPSSAARALAAGATNIERVDKLVQIIGAAKGKRLPAIDETVHLVDGWLAKNRAKAG
jgi:hypothetical protein